MTFHVINKDSAEIFLIFPELFLGTITCDCYCGYTIQLLKGSDESTSLRVLSCFCSARCTFCSQLCLCLWGDV